MIIKRRGHRESTKQSKSTERKESKEKAESKSKEQNQQKDNRHTVQLTHSMYELVMRRRRNDEVNSHHSLSGQSNIMQSSRYQLKFFKFSYLHIY